MPNLIFWENYTNRQDLKTYMPVDLCLYALELKFRLEDIEAVARESVTEECLTKEPDKKSDVIYINADERYAVIAQSYKAVDLKKAGAKANKASDLNTAMAWLLSAEISTIPSNLQSYAHDLRSLIQANGIDELHIWYVHNLPETAAVQDELTTVKSATQDILKANYPNSTMSLNVAEVGVETISTWYKASTTPILVTAQFELKIDSKNRFEVKSDNWQSVVTYVSTKWIHTLFKKYQQDLFSANIRGYLGSVKKDNNINHTMKRTAETTPLNFFVFNNGITAIVNDMDLSHEDKISFSGLAIVNGAQTTGVLGNLANEPDETAKVQIRLIKCQDMQTVQNIVLYNNSQNKIQSADFKSNDACQQRLQKEFQDNSDITYGARRGGTGDAIARPSNLLPSVTAGQILAAFGGQPEVAAHSKNKIWEDDELYGKFFNERTTAAHIMFAFSLAKSIEGVKIALQNKGAARTTDDDNYLKFLQNRGANLLLTAAIAGSLETIVGKKLINTDKTRFKNSSQLLAAIKNWDTIVQAVMPFTDKLQNAVIDLRNKEIQGAAFTTFRSLVSSVRVSAPQTYQTFADLVE